MPNPRFEKAFGTPLVMESNGRPIVISPAANWVYGYDARDGSEVWRVNYGKLGFSTVPRPVAEDGVAYISTSFMQPRIVAVDYSGEGDVTESHRKWTLDKQAPKQPSMLIIKGHLYTVTDNGIAACLNAADGSEIWKARLTGDFSASPLYAAGHIYFFGRNGGTTVLAEGPELKELAKNRPRRRLHGITGRRGQCSDSSNGRGTVSNSDALQRFTLTCGRGERQCTYGSGSATSTTTTSFRQLP